MTRPIRLNRDTSAVLVIDVQDKLLPLIPNYRHLVREIAFVLDGAAILGVPTFATEQYPKGLGSTTAELARRLPHRPEKTAFSCCAVQSLIEAFRRDARTTILLVGIESHVCVLNTALDLLDLDFQVVLAVDAISARFPHDHAMALRRMEQAGVVPTTVEAAVFEWCRDAADPKFKQVSKLVQDRMAAMQ